MNPARSSEPTPASGTWEHFWIWVVGPVIGAGVGALAHQIVRGEQPQLPSPVQHPQEA